MADVVIAIGSNVEPDVHVPAAITALQALLHDAHAARVYQTDAIGRPGQPTYWNTAVRGGTALGPSGLRGRLRALEARHGRVRTEDRFAARTLDLDEIWRDGFVDPEVEEREFLRWCLGDLGVGPWTSQGGRGHAGAPPKPDGSPRMLEPFRKAVKH